MTCVKHHIVLNALQTPLFSILDLFLLSVNFFHLGLMEILNILEENLHLLSITHQILLGIVDLFCEAINCHLNIVSCFICSFLSLC